MLGASKHLDAKFGLTFAVHQLVALWVVIVSTPVLTASVLNFLHQFGFTGYRAAYDWVLHGNPFFPAHVCTAMLLGFLICCWIPDGSALWVWVLPAAFLMYGLLEVPTLSRVVPPEFQAGIGQSRLLHYFGWGCQVGGYCVDQSAFTRPFLICAGYAIGALLAIRGVGTSYCEDSGLTSKTRGRVTSVVGVLFAAAVFYDLTFTVRIAGWHWFYLTTEGVPLAIGIFLFLLPRSDLSALGLGQRRRQPNCSGGGHLR